MREPGVASGLVRLRLDVAYDGTDFAGWADQPGRRTVQGTLQGALATVLRLPDCRLTVAGRTDAGVHARGQVCHLDVEAAAMAGGPRELARRLSRLLPQDVRVRAVTAAPPGFDARFSATWRRYAYRVWDDPATADPLARRTTLVWPRHIDEAAMNGAAPQLLGEHDFAAFCKRREGASTVRSLMELSWHRDQGALTCRVVADAFCRHMVRSLVGCLLAVGDGRYDAGWPRQVLADRVRQARVTVAPAHGLTLEEVGYPADADLDLRATQTRAVRVAR